jgi:hypothetical protein
MRELLPGLATGALLGMAAWGAMERPDLRPRASFVAALLAALLAFGLAGCGTLEETACGSLTYRNGMCEGFDGFRYVQRPPRHWLPGARNDV